MFLNLLVSLCCVAPSCDTLDVATVSSQRNAAVSSLSPVRSISGNGIERLGTIDLHEALNQFSGVSIKDYGGIGGLKTVSVRNMGASHTSIIYDGIAISDAQNGQVDISRFNLDDISSISMSIGMEENIFCSARHLNSAGVLRIESSISKFTQGPTEINARMTFGSFGTYNPHLTVRQRLGYGYALKAALTGTFSEGDYPFILKNGSLTTSKKRTNSDVEAYSADADFYADWNTLGRLKAKINLHSSERGLPGSVILYTENAYERLWDRTAVANAMYDIEFGEKWRFHAEAGMTHSYNRHLDTDPAYPSPQDSRYTQNEYSVAARASYRPNVNWEVVVAEDIFLNSLNSNIPECPFPLRLSNIGAVSARFSGRQLSIATSLSCSYTTESLKTGTAPADRFRLSPIIGLSWHFHKNFRWRTSFKEGFRIPTFNDLYYSRVGNVNLKPEIARQFNTGLTFSSTNEWGTLDITTDLYYNSIKDKIVAVPTMFIWKMRNVGKVDMYGADLTAGLRWLSSRWLTVHMSGNYSLQYALDVTKPESKSYKHQIPYTPRHCGSGNITFETPWVNITYRLNASGKRYSLNQNIPANEIKGYTDRSIAISRKFRFGERHDYQAYISLEGLNLSDENYDIIHYYPMPGRSFRITLKFEY